MTDLDDLTAAFILVDGLCREGFPRKDAPQVVAERFGLPPTAAQGVLVLWEATHMAGGTARERAITAIHQQRGFR